MTAVPSSTRSVAWPMSAIAVSASKSSGICGTQIEAKPSRSAVQAASTSRATFSRYWPLSGPIINPSRTAIWLPRCAFGGFARGNATLRFRERNLHSPGGDAMTRVAVVTGAGSGMGLAIGHRLARDGHAVALLDVSGDAVEQAAADAQSSGGAAISAAVDVSDRAA